MTGIISIVFAALVIELARRRKLREEYVILWLFVSAVIAILALWQDLLVGLTGLIGAGTAESTILFSLVFFFIAVNIHLTVRVSALTKTVTTLVQELALLRDSEKGERNEGS